MSDPVFHNDTARGDFLSLDGLEIPVRYRRNLRARRYLLRVIEGVIVVTVPRGGNGPEVRAFVLRNAHWAARQVLKSQLRQSTRWCEGTLLWFRGIQEPLRTEQLNGTTVIRFGDQSLSIPTGLEDLRKPVEIHLQNLAVAELPKIAGEFAALHQVPLRKIIIGNQRSRWGSFSSRLTLALNWRLIQMPVMVRDYIVIHELMHHRHMDHSERFWAAVRQAFPDCDQAEHWLRKHGRELH